MHKKLHRLDPRTVLYVVALLSVSAMFMNKPMTAHLICILAGVFLISIKAYQSVLCYGMIYGVIALLMTYVEKIDNTTFLLIVVSLSYFAQKFIVLMMMGAFLTKATSMPHVLVALQKMKVPDLILVPFMVAMRFFPSIKKDFRCLKESLKLRKVPITPLQFFIHPLRTSEYMIVPILFRSLKTADDLSASALLRGIDRSNQKTPLYELYFRRLDLIVSLGTTIIIGALLYLQIQ